MTAPTDTAGTPRDWSLALADDVRQHTNHTAALLGHVREALAHGWTPSQLAHEAQRDRPADLRSMSAFVHHRMKNAAQTPPPRVVPTIPTFRQPLPWCGTCSDPITRWTNDLPARRCTCWTPPPTKENP